MFLFGLNLFLIEKLLLNECNMFRFFLNFAFELRHGAA